MIPQGWSSVHDLVIWVLCRQRRAASPSGSSALADAEHLTAAADPAVPGLPVTARPPPPGGAIPKILASPGFLAGDAVHTFLIRHPAEAIRSYLATSPDAPPFAAHAAAAGAVRRG